MELIPRINKINGLLTPRKRCRSLLVKQNMGAKDAGVEIWYGIDLAIIQFTNTPTGGWQSS